jgi:hypothetical protein
VSCSAYLLLTNLVMFAHCVWQAETSESVGRPSESSRRRQRPESKMIHLIPNEYHDSTMTKGLLLLNVLMIIFDTNPQKTINYSAILCSLHVRSSRAPYRRCPLPPIIN